MFSWSVPHALGHRSWEHPQHVPAHRAAAAPSATNLNTPGRQTKERNWITTTQQLSQYDHSNQIKISTTSPDETRRSPRKPAAFFDSTQNLSAILAVKCYFKLQGG